MKSTALVLFICEVLSQACSSIVTRPEIRSLSSDQLTRYFNAVKALRNKNGVDIFMQSSSQHYNNVGSAHGVPAFFPWHREFLRRYEKALQAIDPTIVLPYWDWSRDSSAPQNSAVLSSSMMGGNGRSSDNCVTNGAFSGWNATIPSYHCLKRQFNNGQGTGSFYSPSSLESILRTSSTYDSLRQSIEGSPHGTVHVGIGGNNGDFSYMYSPNDPIFYLHHGFVDLLWNEWQMRNPSKATSYNGKANGASVSISNNLIPFNVPVSQVMSTQASGYCYTYPRYSGALPSTASLVRRQEESDDLLGGLDSLVSSLEVGITGKVAGFTSKIAIQAFAPQAKTSQEVPDPLPDQYIQSNNLNPSFVRKQESLLKRLIIAIA